MTSFSYLLVFLATVCQNNTILGFFFKLFHLLFPKKFHFKNFFFLNFFAIFPANFLFAS